MRDAAIGDMLREAAATIGEPHSAAREDANGRDAAAIVGDVLREAAATIGEPQSALIVFLTDSPVLGSPFTLLGSRRAI